MEKAAVFVREEQKYVVKDSKSMVYPEFLMISRFTPAPSSGEEGDCLEQLLKEQEVLNNDIN